MKSFTQYINEYEEQVWVVRDKDLDAILDVCPTKEDADKAFDAHMSENPDNHLEIKTMPRKEVEK